MPTQKKTLLLYLILCFFFCAEGLAQEIKLQVYTKNDVERTDNVPAPKIFSVHSMDEAKKISDSLLYTFQLSGYIDAVRTRIQLQNDTTYTTHFRLKEPYDSIYLKLGSPTLSAAKLNDYSFINADSSYIKVPFLKLPQLLNDLVTTQMNEGDPFSSVQLDSLKKDSVGNITGVLKSSTPKPRTINTIVIKGYQKVPRAYLSQVANIKQGKRFNYDALIQGATNLEELSTINVIRPPEVKFEENETEVYLYLEKKSVNTFDGLLGFSNNNEENKLRLDGYVNIHLINTLNYAEDISLSYKSDGDDQERITVDTALPYLLNTAFGINGHLDLFRRDSTFSSNRQKFNATYYLNPRLQVYSGYEKFKSENLTEDIPLTAIEDLNANFFNVGVKFTGKSLTNILRANKTAITLEGNFGDRSFEDTTESQRILSVSGWNFFKLNPKNFFYLKNESSWINSESFLTNELKRFGGILSLRGFEENSIDASLYSATQTEYIYVLSPSLFLHSIFDLAYYQNKVLDIADNLYSIGLGFGLTTKTGLLRLNLANGKASDQNFKFSNSKVHISLIANF